ncbi:hypothetical protein A8V01_19475 [Novosphingobium guangzhouense]|uniref:Uncharacterized protein n=2 Tax=Novosphingobium guangzhouense TaxID=1850347 RepID=A0A2K2G0M1_9SPHN|nr:hypothetical protein A8V01_19475 [Novosphingobium guangzhouense]
MMVGSSPFCLNCYSQYKQLQHMDFAQNLAMLNIANQDFADVLGMPHLAKPVQIPPAPFHYNYNQSVTITDSTVGSVNLGTAKDIQVAIKTMEQNGEPGLGEALSGLLKAVVAAPDATSAQKNELLEQIEALTQQVNAKPEERKAGIIKPMFAALKEGAAAISGVAGAWTAVEPLLAGHLQLS